MASALRELWDERALVDRRVWLLTYGQLVMSIGRGVLLPFATLYFYNVRGFPLAVVGLALAIALPLGSAVGLLWGALADRIGRKPLMLLGFVGMAITTSGLPFVQTPGQYVALVVLQATAMSAWSPAARAMVADVTADERRTRAYGLLYLANNAGISLGLLLGGLLALAMPYRILFFLEAGGALGYLVVVALFIEESRRPAREPSRVPWREWMPVQPFRDARFLVFAGAGVLAGFGWSQFYVTYSPFMSNVMGASDAWIGAMFAINTVMVVGLQVPAAAWAERRGRTRIYLAGTYLLAWSLLLTWAAGRAPTLGSRLALMAAAIAVMTLGEVVVVPVGSALVAGLAGGPAHFGKYMAAFDLVWTVSTGVGGAAGGWFFDRGAPLLLWPAMTALVVLSLAGYWWLGRMLPRDVDHPAPAPLAPAPGVPAAERPS